MKKKIPLDECVRTSLDQYLNDLEGSEPTQMFQMVMLCVEKPVLEVAMRYAGGNQSRAAEVLGITRSTLRKKLLTHRLL
jgi:Fis family transcriptional regulator